MEKDSKELCIFMQRGKGKKVSIEMEGDVKIYGV
jgi:hypothetical protein